MPRKKVIETPVVIQPDAAVGLYRDRAGKPMGGMHREGSSYMGFVAEQARATVAAEMAVIVDGNESEG